MKWERWEKFMVLMSRIRVWTWFILFKNRCEDLNVDLRLGRPEVANHAELC